MRTGRALAPGLEPDLQAPRTFHQKGGGEREIALAGPLGDPARIAAIEPAQALHAPLLPDVGRLGQTRGRRKDEHHQVRDDEAGQGDLQNNA